MTSDRNDRRSLKWAAEQAERNDTTSPLKVEQAVARYLAGDHDGWEHLKAICWRAVGTKYAPCLTPYIPSARKAATALFIEEFLDGELQPYLQMNEEERKTALAMGNFRYLPRRCHLRLIDKIRSWNSKKQRELREVDRPLLSTDKLMKSGKPYTELENWQRSCTLSATLRKGVTPENLRQHVTADKQRLVAELGQTGFDAIMVLVKAYPNIERCDMVDALAKVKGVRKRQARNLFSQFTACALAALKCPSGTRALHQWLSSAIREREVPRTAGKPNLATQEGGDIGLQEWFALGLRGRNETAEGDPKELGKKSKDPTADLSELLRIGSNEDSDADEGTINGSDAEA